jgi:hypothetical protein
VKEGQRVAIIESMKTEIDVLSPSTGVATTEFPPLQSPARPGGPAGDRARV